MVRKIISSALLCALLVCALCTQASASTHTIYDEGTISSTYVTYFRDIVSGIGFNENYVAFRSGQYSYSLIVGELEYKNGVISLISSGREYKFAARSNQSYNATYNYTVTELNNFSVECGDYIIYSDIGDYPQLVERGAKYEIINTTLISIMLVSIVVNRIFITRKR